MPPLTVMIKPVSGTCNMRCEYCFYADVIARRKEPNYAPMTKETLEAIIRRSFHYADGSLNFVFQGGEPTLIGIDFYKALVEYERIYNTRGLTVTNAVQTNGYSLSDNLISFFAREHFSLGVSLDGCAHLHDRLRVDSHGSPTYDVVKANIAKLRAAQVPVSILCVVNDYVAREPLSVIRALAPYGLIQFITCLNNLDGTVAHYSLNSENYLFFLKSTFDFYYESAISGRFVSIRTFDNYLRILKGLPPESCGMRGSCGHYFLIESNGNVYPCDFYVHDRWMIGNILQTPLNRLAVSPVYRKFFEDSLNVPEKCQRCSWYMLCRNGCKRERDPQTGINLWCDCLSSFFEYSISHMITLVNHPTYIDSDFISPSIV